MKSRFIWMSFMASLVVSLSHAKEISSDEALEAARQFALSSSPIDEDGSKVTGIVAHVVGGGKVCYFALRERGGVIMVSADDRMAPILGVYSKAMKKDGKFAECPSFWDSVDTSLPRIIKELDEYEGATTAGTNIMTRSTSSSQSGTMGGKIVRGDINKKIENGRKMWDGIKNKSSIRRRNFNGAKIRGVESSKYIIPGFELNGKFTHWNQENAQTGFTGTKPCYNYYMCSASCGGTDSNGLRLQNVSATGSSAVPCGCAATALSCVAQVLGARGIIQSPQCTVARLALPTRDIYGRTELTNVRLIGGEYNWDILPSNYGGSAPAVYSEAEFTDEMRELLGRVTYNFGLAVEMDYGFGESGCLREDLAGGLTGSVGIRMWSDSLSEFGIYNETVQCYETYKYPTKRLSETIRAGIPTVFLIYGASGGHAVNGVGHYIDEDNTTWVKLFMGWSGSWDGFSRVDSNFSAAQGQYYIISDIVFPSGNGRTSLPYNKKVGSQVTITSSQLGFSTNVPPDDSGYVRCLLPAPEFSSLALSNYTFTITYADGTTNALIAKSRMVKGLDGSDIIIPNVNEWIEQHRESTHMGFQFGTPDDIMYAIDNAWDEMRPLLVISGDEDNPTKVDRILTSPKTMCWLTNYFTVFYVDVPYEAHTNYMDCVPAYGVFQIEPYPFLPKKTITFDEKKFWHRDNGRLAYGTFTNEYDVMRVIRKGIRIREKYP